MNDPNRTTNEWNIYTDVMNTDPLAAAGARTPRAAATTMGLGTANR
jgi:hypothetical protein